MDGMTYLEKELLSLEINANTLPDAVYETMDMSQIGESIGKIVEHYKDFKSYIDLIVTDTNNSERDNAFSEKIDGIIKAAVRKQQLGNPTMEVVDYREIKTTYNTMVRTTISMLESFLRTKYKAKEDVIDAYNDIVSMIDANDDALTDSTEVSVYLNPKTIERIAIDAKGRGSSFEADFKNIMSDVKYIHNKIEELRRNSDMDDEIENAVISNGLKLSRKFAQFCISWNKIIIDNFPVDVI